MDTLLNIFHSQTLKVSGIPFHISEWTLLPWVHLCYLPVFVEHLLYGRCCDEHYHVKSIYFWQPCEMGTINLTHVWCSEKLHTPVLWEGQHPMQPDRIKVWDLNHYPVPVMVEDHWMRWLKKAPGALSSPEDPRAEGESPPQGTSSLSRLFSGWSSIPYISLSS